MNDLTGKANMHLMEKGRRIVVDRIRKSAETYIGRTTGLTPILAIDSADIVVAGYPKSGNTWMQFMLSGLVHGCDPEVVADLLVQQLVPEIESHRFFRRTHTPMFFKSHRRPQPHFRRVIHLLRDGRDALVSFRHHKEALGQPRDWPDLIAGRGVFGPWQEHTESWLDNPYSAEIMTVRYEDLKQDAGAQLHRICEFAGIVRPLDWVERVVEHSSFKRMHAREAREERLVSSPRWPAGAHRVRRGEVGSYRDEMPDEALALFLRHGKPTLLKCGYPV